MNYNRRPQKSNVPLVFGVNPIEEALNAGKEIEKILIQKGIAKEKIRSILDEARKRRIPISEVPIQKMNQWVSKPHQGIIAFLALISYHSLDAIIDSTFEAGKDPIILALDNVTDVRNFGAISRSAEAMGVDAIVIPVKGGAMINGDAIKTSAGALNHIPVCRESKLESAILHMKNRGLRIISCTEKSNSELSNTDLKGPICIVLGAEDTGISKEILSISDDITAIPMLGKIGSLNVSVASGVILYEALKQRTR
ncbi:MAG: 23S rRNA (guanosine(2251)-2'-O)-methyltransferase RlmB [Cytophagales bacterium]